MEGKSFEKREAAKSETGPEVDIESVLERGEIELTEPLKGHEHIDVVWIKDDGKGLFKPNGEKVDIKREGGFETIMENRVASELLAYRIDKILGFDLVPPVVAREIEGRTGALQEFVSMAKPANHFKYKERFVNLDELTKTAVFDYLINAQDRRPTNFLLDSTIGKMWLIDHDYYMFDEDLHGSVILDEVRQRGLTSLSPEILTAVTRLVESADSLVAETDDDFLKQVVTGVKKRAKILLETKEIPQTT